MISRSSCDGSQDRRAFIPEVELTEGEELSSSSGCSVSVGRGVPDAESATMYNIEVRGGGIGVSPVLAKIF